MKKYIIIISFLLTTGLLSYGQSTDQLVSDSYLEVAAEMMGYKNVEHANSDIKQTSHSGKIQNTGSHYAIQITR